MDEQKKRAEQGRYVPGDFPSVGTIKRIRNTSEASYCCAFSCRGFKQRIHEIASSVQFLILTKRSGGSPFVVLHLAAVTKLTAFAQRMMMCL